MLAPLNPLGISGIDFSLYVKFVVLLRRENSWRFLAPESDQPLRLFSQIVDLLHFSELEQTEAKVNNIVSFLGYLRFLNYRQGVAAYTIQQVTNFLEAGFVLCILKYLATGLLEFALKAEELICLVLLLFDVLQKLKLWCLDSLSVA